MAIVSDRKAMYQKRLQELQVSNSVNGNSTNLVEKEFVY